jgi:phosphatidyl-myo-inositol dimannoside synthase
MKILHASYNHRPYIGGIETYSNKLEEFLLESKKNSYFVNTNYSRYKVLRLVITILVTFVKLLFLNVEITHLTNLNLWPISLVNLLKLRKANFVINLHGLELVYGNRKNLISRIYRIFVPLKIINKVPNLLFFCNSQETLNLAKKYFNENKLIYIPMGVEECQPFNEDVVVDKNQFFFLGRITKRKGVSWFVREVLPNFPEKKLIVAGPISDKHEFESIIKSTQVEYLGALPKKQIINLHQSSLLTIFPSIVDEKNIDFEGFGISFIEALANGGLPIATIYQGLNSASLNSKIGLCLNDNSTKSWIHKIEKFQNQGLEHRKKMIKEGQNLINENFLWEHIFNKTNQEYKNIIS